jgi:hypothetical protein
MKNAYKGVVEKPDRKRQIWRTRPRLRKIFKKYLAETMAVWNG